MGGLTRLFGSGLDALWSDPEPPSPEMSDKLREQLAQEKRLRDEQDALTRSTENVAQPSNSWMQASQGAHDTGIGDLVENAYQASPIPSVGHGYSKLLGAVDNPVNRLKSVISSLVAAHSPMTSFSEATGDNEPRNMPVDTSVGLGEIFSSPAHEQTKAISDSLWNNASAKNPQNQGSQISEALTGTPEASDSVARRLARVGSKLGVDLTSNVSNLLPLSPGLGMKTYLGAVPQVLGPFIGTALGSGAIASGVAGMHDTLPAFAKDPSIETGADFATSAIPAILGAHGLIEGFAAEGQPQTMPDWAGKFSESTNPLANLLRKAVEPFQHSGEGRIYEGVNSRVGWKVDESGVLRDASGNARTDNGNLIDPEKAGNQIQGLSELDPYDHALNPPMPKATDGSIFFPAPDLAHFEGVNIDDVHNPEGFSETGAIGDLAGNKVKNLGPVPEQKQLDPFDSESGRIAAKKFLAQGPESDAKSLESLTRHPATKYALADLAEIHGTSNPQPFLKGYFHDVFSTDNPDTVIRASSQPFEKGDTAVDWPDSRYVIKPKESRNITDSSGKVIKQIDVVPMVKKIIRPTDAQVEALKAELAKEGKYELVDEKGSGGNLTVINGKARVVDPGALAPIGTNEAYNKASGLNTPEAVKARQTMNDYVRRRGGSEFSQKNPILGNFDRSSERGAIGDLSEPGYSSNADEVMKDLEESGLGDIVPSELSSRQKRTLSGEQGLNQNKKPIKVDQLFDPETGEDLSGREKQLPDLQPLEVYHGSTRGKPDFKQMTSEDLGLHVGDKEQANTRILDQIQEDLPDDVNEFDLPEGSTVNKYNFTPKKPIRMPDQRQWHPENVADELISQKIMSKNEIDSLRDENGDLSNGEIRKALVSKGYDSIVYKNDYDVPGKTEDSHIILDPEKSLGNKLPDLQPLDMNKSNEELISESLKKIKNESVTPTQTSTPPSVSKTSAVLDNDLTTESGSGRKPGRPSKDNPFGNKPPGGNEKPPTLSEPPSGQIPKKQMTEKSDLLQKLADVSSGLKRSIMSVGIPGTGISPHGISEIARAGLGSDFGKDTPKAIKYAIKPSEAVKSLERNKSQIERLTGGTKENPTSGLLKISAIEGTGEVDPNASKVWKTVREAHRSMFEKPLFEKMIPALKVEKALELEAYYKRKGIKPEEALQRATKDANNLFGGLDTEGRSTTTKQIAQITLFAPDWLESQGRIAKGAAEGLLNPKDPRGKMYRNIMLNYAALTGVKYAADMAIGSKRNEKDLGHSLDVKVGDTEKNESGKTKSRYVRPEGNAGDFIRFPIDVAEAIQNDPGKLPQIIESRMAPLARAVSHVVLNRDSFGNPLYGKDKYGKPIDSGKAIGNLMTETIGNVTPAIVKSVLDYSKGKSSPEEIGMKAVGLPISYVTEKESGTKVTKTAKKKKSGTAYPSLF
jgi:uncharacterized protein YidB (DUF937 family)